MEARRGLGKVLPIAIILVATSAACRPAASDEGPDGEALFASICARCHGADGRGGVAQPGAPSPRNFRDQGFQRARSDAEIRQAIVQGRSNGAMPAFGGSFSDEDIDALVEKVRAFGAQGERR